MSRDSFEKILVYGTRNCFSRIIPHTIAQGGIESMENTSNAPAGLEKQGSASGYVEVQVKNPA